MKDVPILTRANSLDGTLRLAKAKKAIGDLSRRTCVTLVGLFVVVLAVGLLVTAAPAEAAAPTCRGGSCTDKDPKVQGCADDARTVRSFVNLSLYVEVRFSPRCQAAWARWTVRPNSDMHFSDYVVIRRHNPNGSISQRRSATGIEPGAQGWTVMISRRSADQFDACNFIARECTKPLWPTRPAMAAATAGTDQTAPPAIASEIGAPAAPAAVVAAAPQVAATNSWNCRVVIADSVGFYAHPTGHDRSSPPILGRGRRFKSFGVDNGRFLAQVSDPGTGWITADSRYVQRVPDSWCVW